MRGSYQIRPATLEDVAFLPGVELAAARLYLSQLAVTGLTQEILDKTNSVEDFAAAQRDGLLWVAVDGQHHPVGFALLAKLEQWLHLDELDVHPDHVRRGVGTALVRQVRQVAQAQGDLGVTLSTFRHVPWNAPFYRRLGFVEMVPEEQTAVFQALVAGEQARGLRTDLRLVMWFKMR
ncbi:MAG: GNAT family N-acetyltransferase [Chloroflexota bacterium]